MSKRRSKGEGTIYQRPDGSWVAQITLPDGKRKTKYGKTQREVREWLQASLSQLRDGVLPENDKVIVSNFLDSWFTEIVSYSLRPKTLESYEYLIRVHIKPEIGNLKLSQLRPAHLQSLYSNKLQSGLSRRTVQYIHSVIHRALNHAVKMGMATRNVADSVTPPRPAKSTPQFLNIEQVKQFFEAVKDDRLFPLYVVAIGTGLRRGEILALTWDCFDPIDQTLQIKQNLQQVRGKGLVIGEPKSKMSRRTVSLPQFVTDILIEQKKISRSDYIFATNNGTPFSPRNIVRHFKATLAKAELPETIRFHDLRHTFASLMLNVAHPKVVQEALGHSTVSITLDTYSHLLPNIQRDAADRLNEVLRS